MAGMLSLDVILYLELIVQTLNLYIKNHSELKYKILTEGSSKNYKLGNVIESQNST